jgi:DNA-binding MarR family transcriptional regulator
MTDQHGLGRLRHAGLTPFDVNILSTLMKMGGEFGLYMNGIAEENRPRVIAGLSSLADRELIMVDEARSTTSRIVLRLTDGGREACAQLERMSVQPRVEVQMHGDTPEVIKP